MKIEPLTPESEILRELGRRLARVRKQQGYTQIQLAEQAGLGVATLRRIEGGQDGQMESWLKLLKALDQMPSVEALLPESLRSPMAEVKKYARKHKPSNTVREVAWGDEASRNETIRDETK